MNHKRQRMSEARQGNRAAETAPNYSAQEPDDCDPGSELQLLKVVFVRSVEDARAYRTKTPDAAARERSRIAESRFSSSFRQASVS